MGHLLPLQNAYLSKAPPRAPWASSHSFQGCVTLCKHVEKPQRAWRYSKCPFYSSWSSVINPGRNLWTFSSHVPSSPVLSVENVYYSRMHGTGSTTLPTSAMMIIISFQTHCGILLGMICAYVGRVEQTRLRKYEHEHNGTYSYPRGPILGGWAIISGVTWEWLMPQSTNELHLSAYTFTIFILKSGCSYFLKQVSQAVDKYHLIFIHLYLFQRKYKQLIILRENIFSDLLFLSKLSIGSREIWQNQSRI